MEHIKRKEIVSAIYENKIVAISRGVAVGDIAATAHALYDGGIRLLEITFNQAAPTGLDDTKRSIRLVKEALGDKMYIGAGTVMTLEQADYAADAGADFALAPDTNPAVIKRVVSLGMAAVPGAMTPSEIAAACAAGADIVKLFPAGNLGLAYAKAIQGPINHVPLMAVGGIDLNNFKDFLDNGFTSVGIGGNIVNNGLIRAGRFEEITKLAREYTSQIITE